MTLVEVMIAFALVVVALSGLSRAIVASSVTTQADSTVLEASAAARQAIEVLEAADFAGVFALYNGTGLAVEGLTAAPGDADGLPLRIVFPTAPGGAQVREDVAMPQLGMPRDLNGDGDDDDVYNAVNYQILPVLIEVDWIGPAGVSHLEFKTILGGAL